ncbi:MAG TPA: OmpA family protein, partial [Cytophagaceae bacterium]|nr:OmpA family protein [Cytophagaceae bacterium]
MKNSFFIILTIISVSFFQKQSLAQIKNSRSKPNANLIMGDKHFDNFEYFLASNEYARVLKADSLNSYAMFQLAECYRLYYNYKAAEIFYHKVANRFKGAYPLARYWYAVMLKDNGDYKKAIDNFEQYRNENNDTNLEIGLYRERAFYEIKGCLLAIAESGKPKKAYDFKCLPPPVNSLESDYAPVLVENDTFLAITTSRKGAIGSREDHSFGGTFSDVHRFSKKNDSLWEPIKHDLKDDFDKLNSPYNECSGSFTKDGKKYYFTRCDEIFAVDNYKEINCAIYVSYFKNGKWEAAQRLNNNINAPGQWNSQPSVSLDGNILFFVSKRPGGFGMHDIWYSTCNDDDHWGTPVNLGEGVNTLFSDVSPRYYANEKVLFFSSAGHGGYGALDIFMAREDNGFDKSINIGYPFNTNRDDFHFVMGNKKGYVTSNREGGIGSDDIYTFNFKSKKSIIRHIEDSTLTEEDDEKYHTIRQIREEPIVDIPINKYSDRKYVHLKGILLDSLTNKPAKEVEVRIMDEYGDAIAKSTTSEKGEYSFYNLPTNKEYKVALKNSDFHHKFYRIVPPKIDYSSEFIKQPIENKTPDEVAQYKEFPITFISKDTMQNKKSFAVHGRVIDSITKAPVQKGQVQLIDEFGNVMQVSNLDTNGYYKVESVTDTKEYSVVYKAMVLPSENFITADYKITFKANSQVPETTEAMIAIIDKTSIPESKSITIDGLILYEDTHQPASDATILLADENGIALKTSKTNKNGYYKFSNLESRNTYKVLLYQGNLLKNSENRKYFSEKVKVKVSDMAVSKQLFESIFFDFDSYVLRNEAKKVLDDIISYCKGDSALQIELNANTDSYGSNQYNKILAANRGKSAMDYMVSKGLNQSSIVVNSLGENMAVASNETELGRQLNRRIEFYILGASNIESGTVTKVIETNKTIYSLAKEYNMTVEELKELNGLVGDELVAYTPVRIKRRTIDNDINESISFNQLNNREKKDSLEQELILKNKALNKNFNYNAPEFRKYMDSIELVDKSRTYGNSLYKRPHL